VDGVGGCCGYGPFGWSEWKEDGNIVMDVARVGIGVGRLSSRFAGVAVVLADDAAVAVDDIAVVEGS